MFVRLMARSALLAALLAPLCGSSLCAQETAPAAPKVEPLYRAGVPDSKGDTDKDKPTLTIYQPPEGKANGCAVVVCPGGGYGGLAVDHEGKQVGEWFNSFGVTAFMLKYRLSPYRHPIPLNDAQRAIRTVRARAKEFGVDPARVGILGFSAGGHLASTAGTKFDKGASEPKDEIDKVSCRPDFLILCYPVISFTTEYTHVGSRNNLLGKDAPPELMESLSNEKQVTADTPPTFLFHTTEDTGVPPENSILFYLALRKAKVPCELHIYEKGKHGVGLAPKDPVLSTWPKRCEQWLGARGYLGK